MFFSLQAVWSQAGDGEAAGGAVLWRYSPDRYGRPGLSDPIEVGEGRDPYEVLAGVSGFSSWMTRRENSVAFIADVPKLGSIPVFGLHKISREEHYGLTPERFREFLRYLNAERWYLISDRQYAEGDLSHVPTGYKPIVLGSDDGSYGTLTYLTRGDRLRGSVRRFLGTPLKDPDCMAAILERLAPKENGRINFTFYISFDALPFRQLDGAASPGFPYRGIPVVAEKIRYLDEHFILGIHSLSHIYAGDMGPEAFAEDVLRAWEVLDEYAGGRAESVSALAFPYGIDPLTDEMRRAVTSIRNEGRGLSAAFDFQGGEAPSPGDEARDVWEIPRMNLDNFHWDEAMRILRDMDALTARRLVVWEVESKRLPRSRYSLGAHPDDEVWILVRN